MFTVQPKKTEGATVMLGSWCSWKAFCSLATCGWAELDNFQWCILSTSKPFWHKWVFCHRKSLSPVSPTIFIEPFLALFKTSELKWALNKCLGSYLQRWGPSVIQHYWAHYPLRYTFGKLSTWCPNICAHITSPIVREIELRKSEGVQIIIFLLTSLWEWVFFEM